MPFVQYSAFVSHFPLAPLSRPHHPLPISPRHSTILLTSPIRRCSPVTFPKCFSTTPSRQPAPSLLSRVSTIVTNLFPVWTLLATAAAFFRPLLFSAIPAPVVTLSLSFLMLSMGLTLSFSDLRTAFRRPVILFFALVACYILMPSIALLLASLFNLSPSLAEGLILLGIISGGQASNLCTYIAGGDTALSVAMTTLTTVSAVFMLPVLSAVLLNTVVGLNAVSLATSTAKIVLLPILTGALANRVFPRTIDRMKPFLPILGIAMLVVLIVGPVAQTAPILEADFATLALPVTMLHVLGGLVGYIVPRMTGAGEKVAITTGFETGFKSPALSYVLACRHFEQIGIRVPSAVSIIVLAPLAAMFAVWLRGRTWTTAGYATASTQVVEMKARQNLDTENNVKIAGVEGESPAVLQAVRGGRYRVVVGWGSRAREVGYDGLQRELARARRQGKKILRVERMY